jgi:hypothetical protein
MQYHACIGYSQALVARRDLSVGPSVDTNTGSDQPHVAPAEVEAMIAVVDELETPAECDSSVVWGTLRSLSAGLLGDVALGRP